VWLTATLPPVYQELFLEHNKLVRPHIVRESTNRPNIRYSIRQEQGLGNLCEWAAHLVQSYWAQLDLIESRRDRIIIYCPTKDLVTELADMLACPSYTADSGTEEEKLAIIKRWLTAADSPIIVATSALGPGFDYAHIRLVLHVDAPSLLTVMPYSCILFAVYLADVLRVYRLQGLPFPPIKNRKINTAR
jgi:superfamily II DNA helicase RecQ